MKFHELNSGDDEEVVNVKWRSRFKTVLLSKSEKEGGRGGKSMVGEGGHFKSSAEENTI